MRVKDVLDAFLVLEFKVKNANLSLFCQLLKHHASLLRENALQNFNFYLWRQYYQIVK